ncbi:MAG: site-2 protease family protein [Chloroherpetonaceae bacterium]|nr:site-2 protease family protein [Chthonomonadaceae bacterium]MDW8207888.1 site-2 protease family protein [Chloroherpetonaceae bacterium]
MPTELPTGTPPSGQSSEPRTERRRLTAPNTPEDNGAFRIATVAGIPIRLHWTFLVLLVALGFMGLRGTGSEGVSLLFVLALFCCVVLHELGHALTALRYGIKTRDIVLYPIGGVASLESLPGPRQELWIALAGPAVNVAIAGALYLFLNLTGQSLTFQLEGPRPQFLANLFWINVMLAVFNMLPAFPMDGGRVLRSLLSYVTSEDNATMIAARIGQFIAVLMGLFGLATGRLGLIFIAIFVFIGAGQEAAAYRTKALVSGRQVREAMVREFRTLPVGATLREAADALLAGTQQDFPIVHGGEVVGLLSRSALLQGMAREGPHGYVAGSMLRDFPVVHPDDDLEAVLMDLRGMMGGSILVMADDTLREEALVGMLTQENLLEFLMLSQLQKHQAHAQL